MAGFISAALCLVVTATPGQAALCVAPFPITVSSVTTTLLSPYDPFSGTDATLGVTITLSNSLISLGCDVSISFTRLAGLPAVMSQGANSLQYTIESPGGATLLQTTGFVQGSSPAPANRIDAVVPLLGSVSVNVIIRVPAGQLVAAGNYSDLQVTLLVVSRGVLLSNTPRAIIAQQAFVPSISVVSKCVLPAPSSSTLDFTSAISHGVPNPAIVKSTQFTNVQCTAPSILRLSGSAMQPVLATPPKTGFDNSINWRANGTFGNASSSLNTSIASQADSGSKNVGSGATSNGNINVDVNLLSGNPIISGNYSGVLKVTIDPNL
ncbi:hypothetical protein DLM45_14500 [Hyphomicrobium methylovorum]|nr:hypothetical protein [Hyphomicrobium methylovorum]